MKPTGERPIRSSAPARLGIALAQLCSSDLNSAAPVQLNGVAAPA
jgi:hypothetical protein